MLPPTTMLGCVALFMGIGKEEKPSESTASPPKSPSTSTESAEEVAEREDTRLWHANGTLVSSSTLMRAQSTNKIQIANICRYKTSPLDPTSSCSGSLSPMLA